ncbi:MAG: manganese-binding transcriptional regulator MntR [Phycisphaerales bacterium]|nr:manganese-binding transcriptional regulator MntR [Phycisphaerales bacterium]
MPTLSRPDNSEPERFRSTRRAHRNETAQDYVESIAQLIEERDQARVGDLAKVMGVSHVTVTRIITRLAKEGLVTKEPRQPIFLTPTGQEMAHASQQRHQVVLGFLLAIGINDRQAQIDAEGIEHHVSAETLDALSQITHQLIAQSPNDLPSPQSND